MCNLNGPSYIAVFIKSEMARNEEKHYGKLNRLYLMKEKEEYEKANPKRPRLDTLYTVEEIHKWLPSIKKDLDFYLKKSQVTCYSDAHVEECREKVIKLEKEFKAFVRKIKQLNPSPLDAIPWTSRPYKRKKPSENSEDNSSEEFKRIATPVLDNEIPDVKKVSPQCVMDYNLMDQPLNFSTPSPKDYQSVEQKEVILNLNLSNLNDKNLNNNCAQTQLCLSKARTIQTEEKEFINNQPKNYLSIVNYDSSDCEDL